MTFQMQICRCRVGAANVAIEILVRGLAAAGQCGDAAAAGGGGRDAAPAQLLRARLLRRPLRAAAAPPQRTSSKLFLLELVCPSAAAIRQLSREPARPSRM
jgi:hypothetical protein